VIGIGLSLVNFAIDEVSNPRLRTLGNVARAVKVQRELDRQRLGATVEETR
jgi:peptide/nickel transport system permease protein